MNRRERRAHAASGPPIEPKMVVTLDLHCAGPFSEPRQDCEMRVCVPMPFDVEQLRRQVMALGWWVTVTSGPGESPPSVTVLCAACAEAVLAPELIRAARRVAPGSA